MERFETGAVTAVSGGRNQRQQQDKLKRLMQSIANEKDEVCEATNRYRASNTKPLPPPPLPQAQPMLVYEGVARLCHSAVDATHIT